jgi:large repetitive protein
LSENYIADLHAVDWGALPLGHLDLRSNLITDITPLAALSVVGDLDLSYNRISNAAPLTGLHALSALAIRNNLLTSLKPLVDNSGIGTGDTLNIQQNCLSESDPDIKTLKDRGVQMYYQPQGCGP